MTDAGVLILVESVAKFQHRFDNTSDKADAVWQHVHAHFMKSVTKGELPESDGRSAAALQKRWNTELGEFRLWCATANRTVQLSGVPADAVEEMVKAHYRPSTSLLRKHGYGERPMSVPAWSVNGETAAILRLGRAICQAQQQDLA